MEVIRTWLVLAVASVTGCASFDRTTTYQTVLPALERSREAAAAANEQGLKHVGEGDIARGEASFREALRADLSFAPAHNNLGLVLLRQGRFYEAAVEFSFARKLAPLSVEPVINLARLYETVGWDAAARQEYARACTLLGKENGLQPGLVCAQEREEAMPKVGSLTRGK